MSIPHGGLLDPPWIPDRKCQCPDPDHKKCPVVLVNDGYTIDIGLDIAYSIAKYTGKNPYVVINHLTRAKLDPNREISFGAQDNPIAIETFLHYHKW